MLGWLARVERNAPERLLRDRRRTVASASVLHQGAEVLHPGGRGLSAGVVILRDHHGELRVAAGTLEDEVRALVLAVGHELLRLGELLFRELQMQLGLGRLVGTELARATRSGLRCGQTIGRCRRMRW